MSRPSEHAKSTQRGGAEPGAAPDGPGVVRRTTDTAKRVLLVVIGGFAALFAVFNSQPVEVNWIFGDPIQMPLILALAITFAAGAAVGYLWARLGRRDQRS